MENETNYYQVLYYDTEKVRVLKDAYDKGKVTQDQLRNALDRAEITLVEYVKIIE